MEKSDVKEPGAMIVTLNVSELKSLVQEAVIIALRNGGGNAPDELLDVESAAKMLGHSEIWLYRNSKRLPFSVRTGRSVRFSRKGIEKWIEGQRRA
jgi:predicted DNA-binding transcriptional regulator AlpA